MYLRIGAYKKSENDKLSVMTQGDMNEIFSALTAIMSSVLEEGIIKKIPEENRKEVREDFYETVIESLREHEKDRRKFIKGEM